MLFFLISVIETVANPDDSFHNRLPREKPPHDGAAEKSVEQSDDGRTGAEAARNTVEGESDEDGGGLSRPLPAQRQEEVQELQRCQATTWLSGRGEVR